MNTIKCCSLIARIRRLATASPCGSRQASQQASTVIRCASTAAASNQLVGAYHGKLGEVFHPTFVGNKLSIIFTLGDGPGSLQSVLGLFSKHGINMSRIESKPTKGLSSKTFDFIVDFDGFIDSPEVSALLSELRGVCLGVSLNDATVVPWFPMKAADIDLFSTKTLDAGTELESAHPGFSDLAYRARRLEIVEKARAFRHGTPIPRIKYLPTEIATWGLVYEKLRGYTKEFAVEQYNHILPMLEKHCGYSATNIPQLEDISEFMQKATGFSLRPVGGLLSARDFLNALAFRVFFSTQYIRHHTSPLYTPEPDVCHELMGHAPMFADPDFADFSHEIGLASLGASDEDIKRLATCYWFSVEFGLAMQGGVRKAYGAGLLSSFGELEYACAPYRPGGGEASFPEYRPWEPAKAAVQSYPITRYQPVYYVAESLADAKTKMRAYCDGDGIKKGFTCRYDAATKSVTVDRAIVRGQYTVTLQTG